MDKAFLKENRIPGNALIMRFGLTYLVKLIASLSTTIIVHEKVLMNVLTEEYECSPSKIKVINHGIEEQNVSINSDEAKKRIGADSKNVILFFGYITGYKNLGLLLDSAQYLKVDNWMMLIAGGMHPRLMSDNNYVEYVSELRRKADRISEKNILFKGFVPEEEISLYFSASDLVVFPYSVCMASSGPLSLAASYSKPFLVADSFREIIDFDDIIFPNEPKALAAKIDCFFTNPNFRLNLTRFVNEFKRGRSWDKVAETTVILYKDMISP
jgi:glycosyltransferase involved in cell wall biosynthesis